LIIGDIHIPQRAAEIHEKFKELLLPNKMQYVLSPGNVGSREVSLLTQPNHISFSQTVDWLENLAAAKSQAHIVKGDFDELATLPQTKCV